MLIEEYRGGLLETLHEGRICIVDESGRVVLGSGDVNAFTYYRSTSKPFQLLPLFLHGLNKKYNLTDAEMTVCGASHAGEDIHIEQLETILQKTGFREDQLIMKPAYPLHKEAYKQFIREGKTKRKLFHNCAGKHLALMMLQKELTGSPDDYWRLESPAQQEVLTAIANVSSFPREEIIVGIDGCGVPVFGVPQHKIALAYMRLAYPAACLTQSFFGSDASRFMGANPHILSAEMGKRYEATLSEIAACIGSNPFLIRGRGFLCGELNALPNIVAKFGAEGIYALGLKKEKLGIVIKVGDGSEHTLPIIIAETLRQIGYSDNSVITRLEALKSTDKINDNGEVIGKYKPVFKLQ